MARIRSVHPAFFTDEDIVEVSPVARLLLVGLGTEADDKGAFPWKPKTIKMRLFPADMVEVEGLLEELQAADLVRSYEINGKMYGCIRNFRKHQRPKSPNDIHPMSDDFRSYVGLSSAISEIDEDEPKTIPPDGEIAKQMEDGGEDGEEINPPKPPKGPSFDEFWMRCPQKQDKAGAKSAWQKMSVADREQAFDSVADWYAWNANANSTATPLYPVRYLRKRRWEDEGWKPQAPLSQADKAAFWAESIKQGRFVSPQSCPPSVCREMLERGLVTEREIAERGLVA